MWIPANFYIQKGKTLSAEIKCGSELWGKSERKETEERLNHKLNFNHRCLAAAGKVRAITRGGERGHICPSPWRWDPIQSAVADNLVLHIEVAVDQLEEHQRRATRGTRELKNMTCEEGWEKLESLEQRERERNETPLYLRRYLRSFRGTVGSSRVLKSTFWTSCQQSIVGKQFWAWCPCYLNQYFNLSRWSRGRSVQTLVHPHAAFYMLHVREILEDIGYLIFLVIEFCCKKRMGIKSLFS